MAEDSKADLELAKQSIKHQLIAEEGIDFRQDLGVSVI